MFIRQTKTNNAATGESYFTHRLVRGERIAGKVRQITVLPLGRHFPFEQHEWPLLCQRIEEIIRGQTSLLQSIPEHIERAAQRYGAAILARAPATEPQQPASITEEQRNYAQVDVDTLELMQPRTVGVEHLGLHALSQLGFIQKLTELGINGHLRAAIMGNIIGRMAKPASELATWNWLKQQSALGELIDFDFNAMPHMSLYRASDMLMKHRTALEQHIFSSVSSLFSLKETVTLYDLTNTFFEGDAAGNPKAKHGRSKEKRSDCPLVTLGLVLDGSGFVRHSKVFDGSVAECSTLEDMLTGLGAPKGALVIMDAGIATEDNIAWLVLHQYRYLVVKRGGARQFDENDAISIETAGGEVVRIQKQTSEDGKEVRLYCHSAGRERKETAMTERFIKRFESELQKIADGLQTPSGEKNYDKLMERIGRIKQKSAGVSQHYQIDLVTGQVDDRVANDAVTAGADKPGGKKAAGKKAVAVKDGAPKSSTKKAVALTWKKTLVEGTMATHPGVYCLRSNELEWDAEKLWRTYTMLTDLESVFRSLKTELGLRPVYHSSEERVDGHLFITVLAYQCVQVLRVQLKAAGINDRWAVLRDTLVVQQRVTAIFRQRDGSTLSVRKSTLAEPDLMKLYRAIGVTPSPGGTKKMIT
jgi:transposase